MSIAAPSSPSAPLPSGVPNFIGSRVAELLAQCEQLRTDAIDSIEGTADVKRADAAIRVAKRAIRAWLERANDELLQMNVAATLVTSMQPVPVWKSSLTKLLEQVTVLQLIAQLGDDTFTTGMADFEAGRTLSIEEVRRGLAAHPR